MPTGPRTGRPLSILYIAYPLLTVSETSAGGAEQMLFTLEREMAATGHRTTVAASVGSTPSGRLLETGHPVSEPDHYEQREQEHTLRILEQLRQHPDEFDLVHDKSGSFFRHADACPVPVLATLHLPRSFYREQWLQAAARNLFFNCVSHSQARSFADLPNAIAVVQNGIRMPELPLPTRKENRVLWLGRICEEKAPHLAVAAAKLAGVPLTLAGSVYPFSYHQRYFDRAVKPHTERNFTYVEAPGVETKNRLLAGARALLLTSTVEETSSLVAMEAMSMGTPVIAFRRGAFPEIIADGETGFLVDSVEQMAGAIHDASRISPDACRSRVERFFRADRMARDYEQLYRRVVGRKQEKLPLAG